MKLGAKYPASPHANKFDGGDVPIAIKSKLNMIVPHRKYEGNGDDERNNGTIPSQSLLVFPHFSSIILVSNLVRCSPILREHLSTDRMLCLNRFMPNMASIHRNYRTIHNCRFGNEDFHTETALQEAH